MTGTICEGTVERAALGGDGVARVDGCVVFVPGVLPGERVRLRITSVHRSFARAELLDVIEASPDRIEPRCPLAVRPRGRGPEAAPVCPGCAYAHATPDAERRLKQTLFAESLARIGGLAASAEAGLAPPLATPRVWQYRNKIVLHAERDGRETRLGYRGADNRTVLDIPACPLAAEPIGNLLADLRAKPGFFHTLRDGMAVTVRWTERDGALFWRGAPDARAAWLTEDTPAGPLRVPRGGFFQVNPWMVAPLVGEVQAVVREAAPEAMVDLFGGVGLFAAAAFQAGVRKGVGVESDAAAAAAAVVNARTLGMTDYTFLAAPVERVGAAAWGRFPADRTLVVADPPRAGLPAGVAAALAAHGPRDVVYVSCAPDTLARDLAKLAAGGYALRRLRMADLFPRTAHFESVAWLRRA